MDKEFKNFPMGIFIKDFMKMENQVDMDNIFGVQEVFSKETLRMD